MALFFCLEIFYLFLHYRETWLVCHVWIMMDLIAILEMANMIYCVIMNVLALLFKSKIFIYYHFVKI
jgi:hypothetical protein